MSSFKSMSTRTTTGAFCVYLHYLPEADAPFFIGCGSLAHGGPYRHGASRGLKWHRKVVEAGISPDRVIVEIASHHDNEPAAVTRLAELKAELAARMPEAPAAPPVNLDADQAGRLFMAMKQS